MSLTGQLALRAPSATNTEAVGLLLSATDRDGSNNPASADYSYFYDNLNRVYSLEQTLVGLTPVKKRGGKGRVEKWRGGLGGAYRFPALSFAGASLARMRKRCQEPIRGKNRFLTPFPPPNFLESLALAFMNQGDFPQVIRRHNNRGNLAHSVAMAQQCIKDLGHLVLDYVLRCRVTVFQFIHLRVLIKSSSSRERPYVKQARDQMERYMNCAKANCGQPATVHVAVIGHRKLVAEDYFCDSDGEEYVKHAMRTLSWGTKPAYNIPKAACCDVALIMSRPNAVGEEQFVHLREAGGERWLSLYCGPIEAAMIYSTLKIPAPPRPFVHDVMIDIVRSLNGTVKHIVINDYVMTSKSYIADLVISGPNGLVSIDSRPSDAIALAIRSESPIFVAERLLSGVN